MYGNNIQLIDALIIMVAACCTAIIAEALSWLLIYRTEEYQELKKNIEIASKKVDKHKDAIVVGSKQR